MVTVTAAAVLAYALVATVRQRAVGNFAAKTARWFTRPVYKTRGEISATGTAMSASMVTQHATAHAAYVEQARVVKLDIYSACPPRRT